MADSPRPVKAQLIELNADFTKKEGGKQVTVQFNPETLKVAFANQIAQANNGGAGAGGPGSPSGAGHGGSATPGGAGDQSQPASRQFVGAGTTKLSLQLWFDVNAPLPGNNQMSGNNQRIVDVRELTKEVAYFITPKPVDNNPDQFIPPAVRFQWGSFKFDGIVESLEESLDFFSDEGVPLRASMTLNLTQQKIDAFEGRKGNANNPHPGAGPAPGRRPLAQAAAGVSLQSLADSQGRGGDWQAIAEANGIENPRMLAPGQLLDLNIRGR